MILTGSAIEKAVSHGDIVLSPFTPRHLNPNSYNFHLGSALKVPFGKILSTKRPNIWRSLAKIPREGLVLSPRKLYLANTCEIIGSDRYVVTLDGPLVAWPAWNPFVQSYLLIWANGGSAHRWTLELPATQPVRVYPKIEIGQVCASGPLSENTASMRAIMASKMSRLSRSWRRSGHDPDR